MRLTLRTLLAYLDGNLEPDDAEDIGKKIEESEFATKLVHTIRDCTQRPRLGSPALMGRGLGADPNTVAEYLEYRLADERVPEFERICLESEVHLAEVASSHQILTLVLGEPAAVDPKTRERMYALAAQADAPPVQTDAIRQAVAAPVVTPPATAVMPPAVRRAKPEVPDYLRESSWSIWPIVGVVLIAASLTFAGLFFFGPASIRQSLTALVAPTAPAEPADSEAKPDADAAPAESDSATTSTAIGEETPPAEASNVDAAETEMPASETMPAGQPVADADVEPAAALEESVSPDGSPAPPEEATAGSPVDPTLSRPAADMPPEEANIAPIPPEPSSLDTAAAPRPTLPGFLPGVKVPPADEMPDESLPPSDSAAPTEEPPAGSPARAPAEGFGRFTTTKREVLLKFDPAHGEWTRLPVQSPLDKGDHLMSLPLFRPTITLSSNITIQADGAAEFELVGWDERGTPILAVQYGRLLMLTVGRANNSIRLRIDGQEPVVTFVDPESTLAIEVRRQLPPGKNPEQGPAQLVADLYATSGVIRIEKQDAAPIELQAPAVLALASDQPEPQQGKFPDWVTGDEQSGAERSAASDVSSNLSPDKSAGLQLRELLDPQHRLFRRREVQALAIRSLTHLGDFEPAIAAFNEADLKNAWSDFFAEMKDAIARSPQTASRVRASYEKQRGDADGRALYRMLWGYSVNDLQTGSDRDLIDAISRNDALDFRVLGLLNLQQLSPGGATHGYHPEDTEIKRRIALNTWKGRIGKLVPKN